MDLTSIIFFQTISGVNFAKGAMKNDLLNDLESKEVIKEINKYEKENKITIENVVAYYDQNPTYVSQGVKSAGDMNPRAFGYSWSYRAALATRIKRTLKDGKLNSKIEKICKDQDWLEYEKEQLHFENDTLYVCIY